MNDGSKRHGGRAEYIFRNKQKVNDDKLLKKYRKNLNMFWPVSQWIVIVKLPDHRQSLGVGHET
jgi:hypothetical protein